MNRKPKGPLRRGWTTGACATAASKAAYTALLTGTFPDPVTIRLPRGETPAFALAREELGEDFALAGIVKDAGDDPDVTHHALIVARVARGQNGAGVTFKAGPGVGTVTKPGLPLAVGEPAINPVPRRLMREAVLEVAQAHGEQADLAIEISVPGGERLAQKTWNPRLGILGGISILGTTGVVVPYSCSAWIHSIHRGIDVARATGLTHVAGCTGSTSQAAVQELYGLNDSALLDMGDFAGGLLKYLRKNPLPALADGIGANPELRQAIATAETAMQALDLARTEGLPLADVIAQEAKRVAAELAAVETEVEVLIFDRKGQLCGRSHA
jgi:cobalt-precorrin-5B (C1)-methyltransferase